MKLNNSSLSFSRIKKHLTIYKYSSLLNERKTKKNDFCKESII